MGSGLKIVLGSLSFSVSILFLSSCSPIGGGFQTLKETNTIEIPLVQKVTRETYMNGDQFCKMYVNTGESSSYEIGKKIEVPFNYSDSSKTIKIYAYTRGTFNPSLPSMIFVDGGPGQNTHRFPNILKEGFNEIYFDQRGVGCSAPQTWDEYTDPSLYSSLNTARDIDEIRKAYGLDKVTVYGISYGTVPATIYAHLFEQRTRAVVLEGVLGEVKNLSREAFRAEKYNLILAGLNESQREAFSEILSGDDEIKRAVIFNALKGANYIDGGYRGTRDISFKKLFNEDGSYNDATFTRAYKAMASKERTYNTPQQPGAVDENVLMRFYCKELDGFSKDMYTLRYQHKKGFYEAATFGSTWAKECADQKITTDMQVLYDESKYTTNAPVYYFQGSHDGATRATGALNHWKTVPQKESYLLLALKGGHNPGTSKLFSPDPKIAEIHGKLFFAAFSGKAIDSSFVKQINATITSTTNKDEEFFKFVTWAMYTDNKDVNVMDIEKEFGGLRRLKQ